MQFVLILFVSGLSLVLAGDGYVCSAGSERKNQNTRHFDPTLIQLPMMEEKNDRYVCDDDTVPQNSQTRCCIPVNTIWDDGNYISYGELPMRVVDMARKIIVASHIYCDPYSDLHTLLTNAGATPLDDGWTILIDEFHRETDCYEKQGCAQDILKRNHGNGYDHHDNNCGMYQYHYLHEYTAINEYSDLTIMPLGYFQTYIGWHADFPNPGTDVLVYNDKRHLIRVKLRHPIVPKSLTVRKKTFSLSAWSKWYLPDVEYTCPNGEDHICVSKTNKDGDAIGMVFKHIADQVGYKQHFLYLMVPSGNAISAQICTALDIRTTGNEIVGIQFFLKGCYSRMDQEHPAFRIPIKFAAADVSDNMVYMCVNGDGTALTMAISAQNVDGTTLEAESAIINVNNLLLWDNYVAGYYFHPRPEPAFGSNHPDGISYGSGGWVDLNFGYHAVLLDAKGDVYAPQSYVLFKQGNREFSIVAQLADNITSLYIPGQEYLAATTKFDRGVIKELLGIGGMDIFTAIYIILASLIGVLASITIFLVCPIRLLIDYIADVRRRHRKSDKNKLKKL